MEKPLHKMKIAVLAGNGFNEKEMTAVQRAFTLAGAELKIISVSQGLITGWQGNAFGHHVPVDSALSKILAADFDALVIPGGDKSIAKLSETAHTNRFIKGFLLAGSPILAFGDSLKLVLSTGLLGSYMVTGPDVLKEEVASADAYWSDDSIVISNHLITAKVNESELNGLITSAINHFETLSKAVEAEAA